MFGILINYVKKQDQSKQRKWNSHKSEREREMLYHSNLLMPSRYLVRALNFKKPTALTYENKLTAKQAESWDFLLRRNRKGYERFH